MFELIGLIGSLCFAVNSWPQAWMAYKNKTAQGVSLYLLIFATLGGACSLVYVVATKQYAIIPNFLCGLMGILVVFYYKLHDIFKGAKQ
ncbi:MAG: PQ-loop repeat-containing protein [Alphaproteobacteria bacterium]|nr:PQ-loop repeat-containing protein [Alphaproteobacteria bacterium]